MRKVIFSCASSLDHFIARDDGSFDWILHSDESSEMMKDLWRSIGTMIMGRKTYDIAQKYAPKTKKAQSELETFVFSRSIEPGVRNEVTFVNTDPGAFVLDLKRQNGKDIFVMSGGSLLNPLLKAGAVDEIALNIHPILLGSGTPLFHKMNGQVDLELVDCRPFKNGCVYVLYRVKN